MSELMVLFQALLLVAGWLLFLKAQAELRAQSARQSLTGEMEALRQTIDALLNRLLEEAERAEQRIRAETERAIGEIGAVGKFDGSREWRVGRGEDRGQAMDTPLPMREGQGVRAETTNNQGASQTPLPHSVGEGMGGRATENLTPLAPLSASDSNRHSERNEEPQPLCFAQDGEQSKTVRGQGGEVHSPIPHSPFLTSPLETSEPENRYNLSEQERPTFGVVAVLAEQGLSVQEIARQTGYAPGEVELILNLKRHLSEENR